MERKLWNPYVAGVALGLVLLAAFLVLGQGLGASGAVSRASASALHSVAPEHAESNVTLSSYFEDGKSPLDFWLVFLVVGVIAGGAVSSALAGRLRAEVVRGPRFGTGARVAMAIGGGILMGFAARLARGCTSGQALSGGALLSAGSWIFMLAVFAGGYGIAWLVRRQWT